METLFSSFGDESDKSRFIIIRVPQVARDLRSLRGLDLRMAALRIVASVQMCLTRPHGQTQIIEISNDGAIAEDIAPG
jgi:hypothetical protein